MKSASSFLALHNNKMLCVMIACLLLCSCMNNEVNAKKTDMEVTKYNIAIVANKNANINSVGDPAPIKINIFTLRSKDEFMDLDFFDLQNKPREVLGDNLLTRKYIFLLPDNKPINISGEVNSEYKYVGISGEFQNLKNKTWRIVIPISPIEKIPFYKFWKSSASQQELNIVIDDKGLSIVKEHKEKK